MTAERPQESQRPQESHLRDLEMNLREAGTATSDQLAGSTRRTWVRKDLKRKLDRHVGMEVDDQFNTTFSCVPDKERNGQTRQR